MNPYKVKYLKYKNKYLDLKYGGTGVSDKILDEKQNIKYNLRIERINISTQDIKNQYIDEEIKDFKITKNFKISNIPDQLDINCIVTKKENDNNNCKNFDEQYLESLLENLIKQYNDNYTINSEKKYVQKIISKPNEKFIIIGDIHCDLVNFKLILKNLIKNDIINDDFEIINENYKIIFLGDMVDYGLYGIETVMIILLLKNKNFNNVYIISGNHEQKNVYSVYDLSKEIEKEITNNNQNLINNFESFFKLLPVAIFLKYNNDKKYYQFCHGGVPLEYIKNEIDSDFLNFLNDNKTNKIDISDKLSEQFLWNDFINGEKTIIDYIYMRNKICSKDISIYLEKYNIYSIISGHQDLASLSFQILNEEEKYRNSYTYNNDKIGKLSELKNNNNIILDPTNDFLSIITSNAVKKISEQIIPHIVWLVNIKKKINSMMSKEKMKSINKHLDKMIEFFNVKYLKKKKKKIYLKKKIQYIVSHIYINILKNITPNYLVLSQDIPK